MYYRKSGLLHLSVVSDFPLHTMPVYASFTVYDIFSARFTVERFIISVSALNFLYWCFFGDDLLSQLSFLSQFFVNTSGMVQRGKGCFLILY